MDDVCHRLLALLLVGGCAKSGGQGSGAGTDSSDNGSNAPRAALLAYAQCMRASGVPNFPDPDPSGRFGVEHGSNSDIDTNAPTYQAAAQNCRALLPGADQHNSPQNVPELLKLAQCLRANGVPNFPDPGPDGFAANVQQFQADPQFQAALPKCQQYLPQHGGG
jgi:hypothetical protein